MRYILLFVLVLLFLLFTKLVLWGMTIGDMIHNWKYYGKLPDGVNMSQPISIPIDCLDSGKKMSSVGCMTSSAMAINEYELPDKLLFA